MKRLLTRLLNLLYIKFVPKFIGRQTFFYAVCGGSNMVLDMVLYAFIYNFVICKRDLIIGEMILPAAIISFLITFPIIFATGLWLAKNITFTNSINSSTRQSYRYFGVTVANIIIKSSGIKILTMLSVWPSFANASMTVVTVIFSYLMQKYYTFKGSELTN